MKILNFGSLNRDLVYSVDHAVRGGETLASSSLETFCGGKGLNQSLALARAGADVYHAGCIGSDGSALRTLLEESGVDTRHLREVDGPSGHAVIQLDVNGQNSILLFGGANHMVTRTMIDEVLSQFDAGDLLVLQNEISEMPYLLEQGAARGLRVVWNPSPFAPHLLDWPLQAVSYFVVNEIEGAELTGESEPAKILQAMRERYPNARTVLTLGGAGSLYDDGTTVYRGECVKVQTVDTTAAGDTFLGYFFAHLDTRGPAEALRLAATAAAMAVSIKGASNSIPRLEDVEAFRA